MILDTFVPIGNILTEIIDETKSDISEDFYQNRWKSIFQDSQITFNKDNFLDIKLAYQKISSGSRFKELEQMFLENDEIKNANLQKEDFGDFIQTYFYKINKYEFDDETFRETCVALERRIKRKYSKKSFFFIPLWGFDSEIEFQIDNFTVRKVTSDEFDVITGAIFSVNQEEPPVISYHAHKLRYVLEFEIDKPEKAFDPIGYAHIFLDSLRILKKGNVNFGSFYQFHPDDWISGKRPADHEPNITHGKKMDLNQTDEIGLKSLFSELKKINESGKCQNHTSFEKECKPCEKKFENIRYLKFAIRRFQYIFRQSEIEDNITDLMISMEAMLNNEPFEIRDKTSRRAGFFLEESGQKRIECRDFIRKCYDIRSEIVHAKKRETKIKEDERALTDSEIQNKLEQYVRKSIKKILKLQNEYGSQEQILTKIEDSIIDGNESI